MASESSCSLAVRVVPNAPRNEIAGWSGDSLRVKIHAPALDGRANQELCLFLAEFLGQPKRAVFLLQGDKSRQKVVRIDGLTTPELSSKLPAR